MVDNTDDPDRQRGILSTADREFLITKKQGKVKEEYSRQARSKRKKAICERFYHAILDFPYLREFWDEESRESVFNDLLADWRGRVGLSDMMAIFYIELTKQERFDEMFGRGIRSAEASREKDDSSAFVSVRPIDEIIERLDQETIEQAIWKYGQGDPGLLDMTEGEMRILIHLLQDTDFDRNEFEEIYENLEKTQFEQQGGHDTVRKEEWKRAIMESRKHHENETTESTDTDSNGK